MMPLISEYKKALSPAFYLLLASFILIYSNSVFASSYGSIVSFDDVDIRMVDPYQEDDITPIRVGAKAQYYNLVSAAKYLEDKSGELTIEDVTSEEWAKKFTSTRSDNLNLGITSSTYWIKVQLDFPLQNLTAPRHKKWLLEVGRAQMDQAVLYSPSVDGYTEMTSDRSQKISEKDVKTALSVFPIEINAGEKKTYYLRVASGSAMFLPLGLWDRVAFLEKTAVEEYLFGAFFGAMMILVLYNFFLYISLSDNSYLYYSAAFFFFTMFEFIELGRGYNNLGDFGVLLSKNVQPYVLWLSWGTVILFARNFLNTKVEFPSIDFILKMTLVVGVAHVAMSFWIEFMITQMWLAGFSLLVMLEVSWISYYAWLKGNQSAFFFLLPWIVGILGGGTYALVLIGFLPATTLFVYSAPLGILACSILLSFALADRIRRMRAQTLNANQQAVKNLTMFQALFNNAVDGMYRLNLNGDIVSANPSLATLMGYENLDELIINSRLAVEKIFPDFSKDLEELADNEQIQQQFSLASATNERVWISHNAQLIYDEHGDPSHIEGTLVDITSRVERENAEQDREREKIEREVAEASASAKSSFLANMSHEIRTPLTAIIGYSEILADPSLDVKESEQSLDTVIRSGHHLLDLIKDILDVSNIEAQRLQVDCKPLDVFLLLRDVEAYFSLKAEEKGIYFRIEYEFPMPSLVVADLTRLKQILLNLCSNAIKFTKEGGVSINVKWDSDDQLFSFGVQDTGIGLTEAQRNKLFQSYAQAESSTAREFGGTGLGLVISKQLAELMGGDIVVSSEPGEGSCFTATIGGGVAEGARWIYTVNDIEVDKLAPDLLGNEFPALVGNILVAEDNEDNRYLINLMLNKTGAKIAFVENGLKAVEYIQEHDVNLIVMDMHMPVMNGMDATQAIRGLGIDVPVIATSAGVLDDDVKAYKDAGCDEFLPKPVDRSLFYKTLIKYLGNRTGITYNPEIGPKLIL